MAASRPPVIVDIDAQHLDIAAPFWNKADNRPHQHGFSAARCTDQTREFRPCERRATDGRLRSADEIPRRDR